MKVALSILGMFAVLLVGMISPAMAENTVPYEDNSSDVKRKYEEKRNEIERRYQIEFDNLEKQ